VEKSLIENTAPHSVTLSTNSKGRVQVEVKVYAEDPTSAADQAIDVLNHLRANLAGQMAE